MISEMRRKQILELLKRDGMVFTKELSKKFKVSSMTIRRDLKYLEDAGYLKRTYKGAILEDFNTELSFMERVAKYKEIKKRIAQKAIEYISEKDFIALSGGSTTFQLATLLVQSTLSNLTILTNSLNIAVKLIEKKSFNVIVAGGPVREKSYECIGTSVISTIKKYNINKFFMGVNGISFEKGISMSNADEAEVAKVFIERSARKIVISDHSKIGQVRLGYVCDISDVDLFIIDKNVPEFFKKGIERHKVKVDFV